MYSSLQKALPVYLRGCGPPVNAAAGALHFACMLSNVEVARLLLERGANKELHDKNGHGLRPTSFFLKNSVRKEELLALLARY